MAIINGPYASKMRGKVGEVVAAKTTGNRTAIRSYQPNVKNPNTLRQRVSRMKLTAVSRLAAALSTAIKAGYGLAVSGTKMYPRNMFVRVNLANQAVTYETEGAGGISVNFGGIQMSAKNGIDLTPIVGQPSFATAGKITLPVTAYPTVMVDEPGQMGLVVVVMDDNSTMSIVKSFPMPASGTSNVEITGLDVLAGMAVHVYAFAKWIPETGNEIQTTTEPWKYPSKTSATVYAGQGDIS